MKINGIIPAGKLRIGLEKASAQANNQPKQAITGKTKQPSAIVELEKNKQKPSLRMDAVYTADGFINQAGKRINKLEKMADDLHKLSRNNIKEGSETLKQEKEEKMIESPKILDVSKESFDKFMKESKDVLKNNPETAAAAQFNINPDVAENLLK